MGVMKMLGKEELATSVSELVSNKTYGQLFVGILIGFTLALLVHYTIIAQGIFYNQKVSETVQQLSLDRDKAYFVLSGYGIIEPLKDKEGNRLITNQSGEIIKKVTEKEYQEMHNLRISDQKSSETLQKNKKSNMKNTE